MGKKAILFLGTLLLIAFSGKDFSFASTLAWGESRNQWSEPDTILSDSSGRIASQSSFGRFISRELHNIVVAGAKKKPLSDTMGITQGEALFLPYEGKIIRKITISKGGVFGYSLSDFSSDPLTWTERNANRLHINTRDWVIAENLFIHPGDYLNPLELADNERVIRDMPSIQDVRFIVKPVAPLSDSVDLEILTRDVWSIGFAVEAAEIDNWKVEIWDRNIFGTGHEMQNVLLWNPDHIPQVGYNGYYRVKNIAGSFIDGRVGINKTYKEETSYASFSRNFFSPGVTLAGGLSIEQSWMLRNFVNAIGLNNPVPVKFNSFESWVAKSFPVQSKNWFTKNRTNFVISGSVQIHQFMERPEVDENSLYVLHNRKLFLGSLAFSEQSFYRTNLIYSFGRTEDIPYGSLMRFTFGPEFSEFGTRMYGSFSLAKGNYLGNVGYFYHQIAMGGFFLNDIVNQGLVRYDATGFSNLLVFRRYYFRNFVSVKYITGINRFQDEYVNLNNANGIRGFDDPYLKGIQKFALNFESVIFTPFSPWGFRITAFSFADVGWIGNTQDVMMKQDPYWGIGGGFRIRNERLVFNTLQIRLVWYPKVPSGGNPLLLDLKGEPRFRPTNFYVKAPEIIRFN